MKLKFSRQIFEKYSNIKFHKNPSSVSGDVPCGRTDRRKSQYPNFQFYEKRLKTVYTNNDHSVSQAIQRCTTPLQKPGRLSHRAPQSKLPKRRSAPSCYKSSSTDSCIGGNTSTLNKARFSWLRNVINVVFIPPFLYSNAVTGDKG